MADDLANLPMNFHVSSDERIRAAIIGVPHNRFYPIEANLPLDPRTGVLMERGGRESWKPLPPWTFDALAMLADGQ